MVVCHIKHNVTPQVLSTHLVLITVLSELDKEKLMKMIISFGFKRNLSVNSNLVNMVKLGNFIFEPIQVLD